MAHSLFSRSQFIGTKRLQSSDSRRHRRHSVGLQCESLEPRQVLSITLSPVGGYETDIFNQGAAEGVGYSVAAERLFVANQSTIPATATTAEVGPRIDVVDASNPASPAFEFSIDVSA